jgi:hypothetical protein
MKLQNKFADQNNQTETKKIVVRNPCPINHYDGFKFLFPGDDTYRELILCKESQIFLQTVIKILNKAPDVYEKCEELNSGLWVLFLKIYKFLRNELEGRIKSDSYIGEISTYRQNMIAK